MVAQASRARSRTRTFGESSSLAIDSGTTKPSTGCPGSEDGTGTVWELSPPGTVPVPDAEPVPFPEARGTGLAVWVTGVRGLLPGDGPCFERGRPAHARARPKARCIVGRSRSAAGQSREEHQAQEYRQARL